ncbi:MAG TPA: DUF2314 domain-containing protein [Mucilaginibacter sp.]|nr:DUF2314 domain-containing protein [Mucilaginibacter sp.]
MKRYILIAVCVFATLKSSSQTVVKDNIEYSSVELKSGDKIFLALKDTAQKHLQMFIDELNKHGSDSANYRFAVKSDFVQNRDHEHMWSMVYAYKNGVFKGVFIDSAFKLRNIKMGDKVSIDHSEVEDWSIENISTGKIIGQFSVKYLESKKKEPDSN